MEPMEEDDSFNQPVRGSISYRPQPPLLTKQTTQEEEECDSDDSFDAFEPTQTTNSGSVKSSAGSTQSNEIKAPLSSQPIPNASFRPGAAYPPLKPSFPTGGGLQQQQQNIAPRPISAQSSKPIQPLLRRSDYSSVDCPLTPPPQPLQMSQKSSGEHPKVLNSQQQQNVQLEHLAVKMAKTVEFSKTTMVQKSTASSSHGTPASPNSLARHRSMNSGLRNSIIFPTPSNRGGDLFPGSSPSDRPATPGDLCMLRDQLDNEKKKVLKLQADFQKDSKKKEEEHQRHLAAKDDIINRQKKDLEVLKSSMNCQKKTSQDSECPPSFSAPSGTSTKIPLVSKPGFNSLSTPSTSSDIKKVKPKIPTNGESKTKTPRRLSAFRHPLKEEDEDTFQLNDSFEPSATSTPKISGIPRSGLRRPLDLGDCFDGDENLHGAPTPKRKPVFVEERRRRTRREIEEEIKRIGEDIDLPPEKISIRKEKSRRSEAGLEEGIDKMLIRKMRLMEVRKKNPILTEKQMTSRMKNRLVKGTEIRPIHETTCANCQMTWKCPKIESIEKGEEREWEREEVERKELMKKEAEELKSLHYTTFIHSISRKGIEEMTGSTRRNEEAEQLYQKRIDAIKIRNLEEIREEKRQEWRRQITERLDEEGEMNASLEIREIGRNEDFIWTEDEGDDDFVFPEPYNHRKSTICSDCQLHQRSQRRMAKKEWEMERIKTDCLTEYGIEKREELRNQSILTKSRLEAADQSLFRETEISSFGAFRCMDIGEEGDDSLS